MKTIAACVLLLASMAVGQTVQTARAIGSAPPKGGAAAPGTAATAAGPAAAAGPAVPTFGPAFFGPGINNPIARAPIHQLIQRAQEVVATNPNVRVFVDVDGTVEFTDQFGREVDVLDSLGRDALEIPGLEEQLELQKQQFKINQRRAMLMQQLSALNSFPGVHPPAGLGSVGAAPAAPANRFIVSL